MGNNDKIMRGCLAALDELAKIGPKSTTAQMTGIHT